MLKEEKSNWDIVAQKMSADVSITLSSQRASLLMRHPEKLLELQAAYKFAAKLIGGNKTVLDLDCSDGFSTYLLAKECGRAIGIIQDSQLANLAKANFSGGQVSFMEELLPNGFNNSFFDAITFLNNEDPYILYGWLSQHINLLQRFGVCIVKIPPAGPTVHQEKLSSYFRQVFSFTLNYEFVRPGVYPHANSYLFLAAGR